MVNTTTPLNQIQKIPYIQKIGTITDVVTPVYTVPAGKKALVAIATGILVAYGAGATAGIKFAGVTLINFVFGTDVAGAKQDIQFITLNAGDQIIGAGTVNPTINYNMSIQETPA